MGCWSRGVLHLPLLASMLLFWFLRKGKCAYFQSNPSCGFTNSSDFIAFEESNVYQSLRSLGVCNWGYNLVLPIPAGLSGTMDQCLQCVPVPGSASSCPDGFSPSNIRQSWDLVPASGCQLSGCLAVDCPSDSIEFGQGTPCPGGSHTAKTCCPIIPHTLCCQTQSCVAEATPSGSCLALNSNQDLLPSQALLVTKYAVPVAEDCQGPLYRFTTNVTCQPDRTFAAPHYYDACLPPPLLALDNNACPELPGYIFSPWLVPGARRMTHAWPCTSCMAALPSLCNAHSPDLAYTHMLLPPSLISSDSRSREHTFCIHGLPPTRHAPSHAGDPAVALLDDGTPWSSLPDPQLALSVAAADTGLMSARCDAASASGSTCGWFSTDGTAALHSYLPLRSEFADTRSAGSGAAAFSSFGPCRGTYVRRPEPGSETPSCPRIPGYLFHPFVTPAVQAGTPPSSCASSSSSCWNMSALAVSCEGTSGCVGFSNAQGMLLSQLMPGGAFPRPGGTFSASSSSASLVTFTESPCYGSFELTGLQGGVPSEVESIDRLVCGGTTYCRAGTVRYSANVSSDGADVDVEMVVSSDLQLPKGLANPDTSSAPTLPALTRVRSLRVVCVNGSSLLGGLPRPLFLVFPNLQVLSISGCKATGPLPPEYAQLGKLQVG